MFFFSSLWTLSSMIEALLVFLVYHKFVRFIIGSLNCYNLLFWCTSPMSKNVHTRWKFSGSPHKTILPQNSIGHYKLPDKARLLKWPVLFLKVGKKLQPLFCPVNSSLFVLQIYMLSTPDVLFYWFSVTGPDRWLRSLTLILPLSLCELCFWNVTGTSFLFLPCL